jgi:solute carrier family 25 (mitochondrial carnitine/acylcarnitine transporter), member 20/29
VLVGHPFDLIKVRLQTAEKGVYTSALDVAKKSLARDGFKGLYRGVSAPLIGVTPMFAVSFWVILPGPTPLFTPDFRKRDLTVLGI